MDAQRIAEATRDAMWANDRASKALGMQVTAIGPGTATLTMTVREDMLNGHDLCHGGLIATLADSAFAFSCNAYNEVTVASGFDIHLIAGARGGDVLTAVARELSKSGRTGVYDITVSNQRGEPVAAFRGRSYTMKGKPVLSDWPITMPSPRTPNSSHTLSAPIMVTFHCTPLGGGDEKRLFKERDSTGWAGRSLGLGMMRSTSGRVSKKSRTRVPPRTSIALTR